MMARIQEFTVIKRDKIAEGDGAVITRRVCEAGGQIWTAAAEIAVEIAAEATTAQEPVIAIMVVTRTDLLPTQIDLLQTKADGTMKCMIRLCWI